jgi:hypothetical protein
MGMQFLEAILSGRSIRETLIGAKTASHARPNLCRTANLVSVALLGLFLVSIVVSLTTVEIDAEVPLIPTLKAILGTTLIACLLSAFLLARFSFGYIVSVAFYGVITGFVWLSYFTFSQYDHATARWSAIGSLFAFSIPALFQTMPARRVVAMTPEAMDLLLKIALGAALAVLGLNIPYGFAFVGIAEAERLRAGFSRPDLLNYVTNILIYAVLPFSFAFFAQRRCNLMAAASLLLILLFYPILLNKTVVFAAGWLPFLFLVFRAFEAKQASALSLIIPLLAGLLLFCLAVSIGGSAGEIVKLGFGFINGRMFAVPSIAIDYYAEFFATNPHTHFCQINLVRAIAGCPYSEQLGVIFADRYHLGNLNASLFATEGIASVGLAWAPVAGLFCGLVLSLGNSLSRHLPASLVAASAGLCIQALLNVPLSTSLLTYGLMVLFLLWYICPDIKKSSPPEPGLTRT